MATSAPSQASNAVAGMSTTAPHTPGSAVVVIVSGHCNVGARVSATTTVVTQLAWFFAWSMAVNVTSVEPTG